MHGTRARVKPKAERQWSTADLELLEELACAEARESFWAFRNYMRPKLLDSWFQRKVAAELQKFYEDSVNGLKPSLVLVAPPQHGKTEQITDFVAWIAGKNPDLRSIFCSYSDNLGTRVNAALQRMILSPKYVRCFAHTQITDIAQSTTTRYQRNSKLIEYVDKLGSFRNTTIDGQINGQGLDLGLIDDPIKGRKEAQSKTIRDSTWDWLTNDFFSRFSENAGMLMIQTRWHVDDPVGRWLEHFPETKVLRFPAIAERDEEFRLKGEALFPAHKSLDFLGRRKKAMTNAAWQSVYQGNPIIVGGGLFPIDKFTVVPAIDRSKIRKSVRYWDKAGTQDGGAYTAGVLMHKLDDGRFLVEDVRHGQWGALTRETNIKNTTVTDAHICPNNYFVYVEQEPGSGGKESAENTVRMLSGYRVFADRVTGDKEYRAEGYAAQVQAGNVMLKAAEWNEGYIDEHEEFPSGKFKDQVDGASGAFNKLVGGSTYDTSMSWVE